MWNAAQIANPTLPIACRICVMLMPSINDPLHEDEQQLKDCGQVGDEPFENF
jgi:hypothetical protein